MTEDHKRLRDSLADEHRKLVYHLRYLADAAKAMNDYHDYARHDFKLGFDAAYDLQADRIKGLQSGTAALRTECDALNMELTVQAKRIDMDELKRIEVLSCRK